MRPAGGAPAVGLCPSVQLECFFFPRLDLLHPSIRKPFPISSLHAVLRKPQQESGTLELRCYLLTGPGRPSILRPPLVNLGTADLCGHKLIDKPEESRPAPVPGRRHPTGLLCHTSSRPVQLDWVMHLSGINGRSRSGTVTTSKHLIGCEECEC